MDRISDCCFATLNSNYIEMEANHGRGTYLQHDYYTCSQCGQRCHDITPTQAVEKQKKEIGELWKEIRQLRDHISRIRYPDTTGGQHY